MDVNVIWQIMVVALIVEAVWETLKMTWAQKVPDWNKIGTIVVGLLVAFGARVDLFAIVDIPLYIPYLGYVLTGLLISRGSSFVHALFVSASNLKQIAYNKAVTSAQPVEPVGECVNPVNPVTSVTPVARAATPVTSVKNGTGTGTGTGTSTSAPRVIKKV